MVGDFILTLRMQGKGGLMRTEIKEELSPTPGLTWVIFIHGFGVPQVEALTQWEELRSIIGIPYKTSRVQPGVLLWPSDRSIFYSDMIEPAEMAGQALGRYLEDHPGSPAVLLGHSLGARVAVEAADYLRGGVQLHGLVLLGAAVGVSQFEINKRYNRTHAKREAVGFSPDDKILKRWFRPGEKIAAPRREIGNAVGLTGDPRTREWERRNSKSNDHSYWKLEVSGELTRWALDSAGTGQQPKAWTATEYHADQRDV